MQSSSSPVTPQELELVKSILSRLEAQGTSIHPSMWSVSAATGAMADSSKRRLDVSDAFSSEDEDFTGKGSGRGSDEFQLIRDTDAVESTSNQQPIVPKDKSKLNLPKGVPSLEKWGQTICSLPKVKEEAPTYLEIATLDKYGDYRQWIYNQGATKGARAADLRNYLMAGDFFSQESDVMIPGSNEVRRFRQ